MKVDRASIRGHSDVDSVDSVDSCSFFCVFLETKWVDAAMELVSHGGHAAKSSVVVRGNDDVGWYSATNSTTIEFRRVEPICLAMPQCDTSQLSPPLLF